MMRDAVKKRTSTSRTTAVDIHATKVAESASTAVLDSMITPFEEDLATPLAVKMFKEDCALLDCRLLAVVVGKGTLPSSKQ